MKKGSPLSRRERESDFIFSSFERRKRILLDNLQFREEKEKCEIRFSTFEKRKRNGYYFLKIQEEKENSYQAF